MNKVVWEKFATRRGALLKADIYVMLLRKALQKHFGYDTKNFLVCGSGLETQWYLDTQMKRDFGDIILDHFFNSLSRKEDPFQLLKRLKDELMEFTANIKKRKVTSSKEILKTYLEFLEKLGDYQLVIWFPVICEEELFPCAKKRLRKYGCDESDWIILTTPIKPSLLQREYIDLLRTAKNFSPQRLKAHHKKYSWMSCSFVNSEGYPLSYYINRIKKIEDPGSELKKIEVDIKNNYEKFNSLIKKINPSQVDRQLFIFVNQLNHLRQTRDDGRRRAYHMIRPLFNAILKELSTDFKTLLTSLNSEIVHALCMNLELKTKSRSRFLYLLKDGQLQLITSSINTKLKQEALLDAELNVNNIVKGKIANKGKVRGKVKHISINNWQKDIDSFQKGDILIAKSTKAEYLPAMEKAAAFVTDEGGITCHAAIVAREMKKPCVIGTKIATRIFKDGDMVEVDADAGIVKKID